MNSFPLKSHLKTPRGGGEGYSLIQAVQVCAAPTGRVFAPFWSGIGYGFRGNYGSAWRYLSFQFQMSKKEREICEFEMDLMNFCVCALIYNDSIISAERPGLKTGMDFRGLVWKRVWIITFFAWNRVRIWRTGRHTPSNDFQVHPPSPPPPRVPGI